MTNYSLGRRQKFFRGRVTKERPKNSTKKRKISLLSLFQGEGPMEKRPKYSKKKTEK